MTYNTFPRGLILMFLYGIMVLSETSECRLEKMIKYDRCKQWCYSIDECMEILDVLFYETAERLKYLDSWENNFLSKPRTVSCWLQYAPSYYCQSPFT